MFRAVILGAPASGKGTISSRLVKRFELTHISSGDLLRNQIRNDTKLGKAANELIKEGKLLPDSLVQKLMLDELSMLTSQNWLLDGFPRTRGQGEALMNEHKLHLAIALDVPVEEIIDRVKGRWVHIPSGRVYNDTFNRPKSPGIDDVTGEALTQRPDDTPQAIRLRLKLYTETIQPLMNLYESKGILKLFSGRTSDEIWPLVSNVVSTYLRPKPI